MTKTATLLEALKAIERANLDEYVRRRTDNAEDNFNLAIDLYRSNRGQGGKTQAELTDLIADLHATESTAEE
jgi:hypothetical protein